MILNFKDLIKAALKVFEYYIASYVSFYSYLSVVRSNKLIIFQRSDIFEFDEFLLFLLSDVKSRPSNFKYCFSQLLSSFSKKIFLTISDNFMSLNNYFLS